MYKVSSRFLLVVTVAAAILGFSGCSDIEQHHVKMLKDYGGHVSFLDGPTWQYTGVTVTGTDYWDGRISIDLPLDRSSEAKEVYQTADGALLVDMNVAFSRDKTADQRKKWFVNTTNALGIVKKDVEGIARSVVHNYSNAEILNAELALKGGKLPVYTQIQAELGKAGFNDEYGIDKKTYAVWPGNVSPQQGAVQADLDRQRNNLLNAAKLEGQLSLEKAANRRAEVDRKYADFIRKLTPAQQTYLRTLDMSNAIKQHQRPESTEKIEFLLGGGRNEADHTINGSGSARDFRSPRGCARPTQQESTYRLNLENKFSWQGTGPDVRWHWPWYTMFTISHQQVIQNFPLVQRETHGELAQIELEKLQSIITADGQIMIQEMSITIYQKADPSAVSATMSSTRKRTGKISRSTSTGSFAPICRPKPRGTLSRTSRNSGRKCATTSRVSAPAANR